MRPTILYGMGLSVLLAAPLAAQTLESVICPTGLTAGGPAGIYTVILTSGSADAKVGIAAVGDLVAIPDSANTAVVTVPANVTYPAGATSFTFLVTPVGQGTADVGITVNGSRLDCAVAVAAAAAVTPTSSPTLSVTGMLIMAAMLAVAGMIVSRRL